MATLSRTKKYQDLRDRLQNESNVDNFSTTDLSRFEKRLNDLDAQNFSLPDNYMSDTHNATHARNHDIKEVKEEKENPFVGNPDFDTSSYYTSQNNSTFDNDYLDQYIREVKQYNIDQGNASVENTQLNILKQIERNNNPKPTRPYYREDEAKEATTDIPVFSSRTSKLKTVDDYEPSPVQEDEAGEVVPTQVLSKEDIMAEVQNLVNGDRPPLPQDPTPQPQQPQVNNSTSFVDDDFPFDRNMSTDTFNRRMEIERTTRQQLLNETTQMRAQLDDYEDNLSEVSDKMRQTNKILNIVLMILIVFLAVVVGFVIYWIIISK